MTSRKRNSKKKKKLVRRWLLIKGGKRRHYWISEKKLYKEREWDSHLRAWKPKIKEEEVKKPEEVKKEELEKQKKLEELNEIKQTMLKLFEEKATPHYEYYIDKDGKQRRRIVGIKGYDNMHFKRDLDKDLEGAQVQDEGDGWYQLNGYTGKTPKSAEVKIRYNPKQKLLQVYIRDYEVK